MALSMVLAAALHPSGKDIEPRGREAFDQLIVDI